MKGRIKPFTQDQTRFIRKAFLLEGVQDKFNEWIDKNLIYCEDTHSFVHLCFDQFKYCKDHREAQHMAFTVLDLLRLQFLHGNYDITHLKEKVKTVEYNLPIERLAEKCKKALNQKKPKTGEIQLALRKLDYYGIFDEVTGFQLSFDLENKPEAIKEMQRIQKEIDDKKRRDSNEGA